MTLNGVLLRTHLLTPISPISWVQVFVCKMNHPFLNQVFRWKFLFRSVQAIGQTCLIKKVSSFNYTLWSAHPIFSGKQTAEETNETF